MREELAELMHEIWAGWMNHVFLHCTQERIEGKGSEVVIPGSLVYRWSRQIDTPYDKLSEEEKDSDRREADKVLVLMRPVYEVVRSSNKWNMVLGALGHLHESHSQSHGTNVLVAVEELMIAYDRWLD